MVSIRAALALGFALALGLIPAPRAAAAPVPLSAAETAACEKGFDAAQQATRSFRAILQQTLTLQGLEKPVVSTGELFYLAPDRLLIRFSDPSGEWMRIVGKQMYVQKTGQPLLRRDLGQGGESNAATMLDFFGSNSARWDRDFQVSMSRDGDRLLVSLVPWRVANSPRQGVDRIVTTLQLPGYDVAAIEVVMNQSNRIEFAFSDGKRNAKIEPSLFSRTP